MLTLICPKLPMRIKSETIDFYKRMGFVILGDYEDYLLLKNGEVEIHFFEFKNLNPKENYGQVYIRTNDIEGLYQTFLENGIEIHPNGELQIKPWKQKEFSLLDPDYNLLTFGEAL